MIIIALLTCWIMCNPLLKRWTSGCKMMAPSLGLQARLPSYAASTFIQQKNTHYSSSNSSMIWTQNSSLQPNGYVGPKIEKYKFLTIHGQLEMPFTHRLALTTVTIWRITLPISTIRTVPSTLHRQGLTIRYRYALKWSRSTSIPASTMKWISN